MRIKRILSFGHAFDGIRIAWREEAHVKIHVVAAVLVLAASWTFHISKTEFIVVLVMIAIVMTAELLNTALEELCDKFQPSHDPHIGKIKDLAAAAVFIASGAAFTIGCIIFIPYLLMYL